MLSKSSLTVVSVLKQMLNCCIERKKARDVAHKVQDEGKERGFRDSGAAAAAAAAFTATKEASPGKSWDSWSDSEEEFFECLSDQGEMEAPQTEDDSRRRAEGRLHQHNGMTLLNSPEPLYVPVTQVCLAFALTQEISLFTLLKISKGLYLTLTLTLTQA